MVVVKILALLALCFFFPLRAWAATYYVDCSTGNNSNDGSSGTPWLTLRHAADTISSGDTVVIKDGTCTSTEASNDAHWGPSGSSGAYTTWKCENHQGCTINGPIRSVTQTNPSYYSFEDLIVTNSGFWWQANVGTLQHFRVIGCDISGGTRINEEDTDRANWSGIFIQDATNAYIGYNHIHDISSDTTPCLGGTAHCGAGIKAYRPTDSVYEHNLIEDNAIEAISDKETAVRSIVRYNILKNNGFTAYYANNQGTSTDGHIYENIIECDNDDEFGIFFKISVDDYEINNNTFYNCAGGQHHDSTTTEGDSNTGNSVHDNIYYKSSVGTADPWTLEFQRWDANEPTTLDYNIYYNARALDNRNCDSGEVTAGHCDAPVTTYTPLSGSNFTSWKSDHSGYDVHSAVGDPLFVDAGEGNFHLQGGSPASGTGTSGQDIGAYPRNDDTVIGPSSGGGGGPASSTLTYKPMSRIL